MTMQMAILFKQTEKTNMFKIALDSLLKGCGNYLLLSSGYFDPKIIDNSFLESILYGFNVEYNRYLNWVRSQGEFNNYSPFTTPTIKLLGANLGYDSNSKSPTHSQGCNQSNSPNNYNCWYCLYNNFYSSLEELNRNNHIIIDKEDRHSWHAKISLKTIRNSNGEHQVVGGIIGSSNLTNAAYNKTFKNECDVFIWDPRFISFNYDNFKKPSPFGIPSMMMVTPDNNTNYTPEDLLKGILQEISELSGETARFSNQFSHWNNNSTNINQGWD